jgi:hypothetical protein
VSLNRRVRESLQPPRVVDAAQIAGSVLRLPVSATVILCARLCLSYAPEPSLCRPPRLSASSAVARTERPGDTAGEAALGSAELFGERDDDAIGAAEVAEPIEILVLRHLADELDAVSPHAGNDVVDVVDGEHDAT